MSELGKDVEYKIVGADMISSVGAGIAQWLEHRTRDRKGRGFESLQERQENFLLQGRLSVLTCILVSIPTPMLPQ